MANPHPEEHPSAAADLSPEQVAAEIRGTLAVLYRRIRQTKQIGDLTHSEVTLAGGGEGAATVVRAIEVRLVDTTLVPRSHQESL